MRYQHDCDCCVYLGPYREYDLYLHPTSPRTVIARRSSDGPDYIAGVELAHPALIEADRRAGFVD